VQRLLSLLHDAVEGSNWQVAEQQSPFVVLMSSHCSPASTIPFPHELASVVVVLLVVVEVVVGSVDEVVLDEVVLDEVVVVLEVVLVVAENVSHIMPL
jgi:hypothetical protein